MSSPVRDPATVDFAARIKAARMAAHLSQVELAAHLSVSARTIQGWEAGVFPQPRHRRAVLAFIDEQLNGYQAGG